MVKMSDVSNLNATGYTGPPEFNPDITYYVCQLNTNGTNTFRLTPTPSDPTGVNAITVTGALGATSFSLAVKFLSYNPAPGGPLTGGQNQNNHSAYSYFRGAMRETDRRAVALTNPSLSWSAALAGIEAWNLEDYRPLGGPSNTAFRYDIDN